MMKYFFFAVPLFMVLLAWSPVAMAIPLAAEPTPVGVLPPAASASASDGAQAGNTVTFPPPTPTEPGNTVTFPPPTPNAENGVQVKLFNPLGDNMTLPKLVSDILAFVVRIGTLVVVFMLVYVGFLFVMARGSASKIEEAKKALLWTVVGALILLGAQAIAAGIQATVQSIGNP